MNQSLKYVFCDSCGAQNPTGKNFCAKCGARMFMEAPKGTADSDISACEKCGHPNAKMSKFCAACSAPLVKDYKVTNEYDYVLVEFKLDHIDFENQKDLSTLTKKITNQQIMVDMTDVKWIDSTGIGALITLVHRFAHQGQDIKFFGIDAKVMSAIRALQADNVLDVFDTPNEILVSWGLPPL